MKHCYTPRDFSPSSKATIRIANRIIDTYMADGLKLTLRQLYYQFVSHHGLANTVQSYKRLASIISDARLAGLVDWDAIEDRGRVAQVWRHYEGIPELIESAVRTYRLDRWRGQEVYVELWVEKQALAGVLEPIAMKWHAPLMVNKGYSSSSAMYEAAQRIAERLTDSGDGAHAYAATIIYVGDHDPSGEDMVRDIQSRLTMFSCEAPIDVVKIALTMPQVEKYRPPPNPAKRTDARFRAYAAKHGNESWEVDALEPRLLTSMIEAQFNRLVDVEKMDQVRKWEAEDKAELRKVVAKKFKDKDRSFR